MALASAPFWCERAPGGRQAGYADGVIVVVGGLAVASGDPPMPAGLPAAVAVSAARRGRRTELVSRIGDDAHGDAVLLALSRAGVGHAAVLRDAGRVTPLVAAQTHEAVDPGTDSDDPGGANALGSDAVPFRAPDLELGLRYLTDFSVVVVADPLELDALVAAADAAAFASAHLVVIVADPAAARELPGATTVLQAPPDAGVAFAEFVAAYAAGLDRGLVPRDAFDEAVRQTDSQAAGDD